MLFLNISQVSFLLINMHINIDVFYYHSYKQVIFVNICICKIGFIVGEKTRLCSKKMFQKKWYFISTINPNPDHLYLGSFFRMFSVKTFPPCQSLF